jgi:hypothetical protein
MVGVAIIYINEQKLGSPVGLRNSPGIFGMKEARLSHCESIAYSSFKECGKQPRTRIESAKIAKPAC